MIRSQPNINKSKLRIRRRKMKRNTNRLNKKLRISWRRRLLNNRQRRKKRLRRNNQRNNRKHKPIKPLQHILNLIKPKSLSLKKSRLRSLRVHKPNKRKNQPRHHKTNPLTKNNNLPKFPHQDPKKTSPQNNQKIYSLSTTQNLPLQSKNPTPR